MSRKTLAESELPEKNGGLRLAAHETGLSVSSKDHG